MDFSWTEQQEELYASARALAKGKLAPRGEHNGHTAFDRTQWDVCASFGLCGLCVPADQGGAGLDHLTSARIVEGFAEGGTDMGLLFSVCAHLFACCIPLARRADEELRKRVLIPLARGEHIGANAMTEAEAGSDLSSLSTRALRDGETYRLTGAKTYVTNGPVADVFIVYATTDTSAGYLGLSAFAVDRSTPGLTVGGTFAKIGLERSPIGTIYLDDCVVPAAHRIGGEGQGALVFRESMHAERACLFAAYLGAMQRQIDTTVDFATQRRQFGRPIGKNQAISHRLADMKLRMEAARWLVYHACWLTDEGRDATMASSLAKLAVSDAAVQSGLDAIQIHGGMGVLRESGVEQALRDAVPATIFSGTSEMQREIVAGKLGL